MTRMRVASVGLAVCAVILGAALAADEAGTRKWRAPDFKRSADERIETRADRMNFNRETGVLDAVGNVYIRQGDVELNADVVRYNTQTGEARARGAVTLKQGDQVWTGESLEGNLKTKEGITRGLRGRVGPFNVAAETTRRNPDGTFRLEHAELTTCTNGPGLEHYVVRSGSAEVLPGEHAKMRNAVWYFGPVPVMYIPYWYRNLHDDFGFRFAAGQGSRVGLFLLSSYRYGLAPGLKGETHLDYRTKRGVAVGQDFDWNLFEGRDEGEITGYFADDQDPLDDTDDPATTEIESQRYRFTLENVARFSPRDTLRLRGQYVSDVDFREDFFEDEYRNERQPDNLVNYTHREDAFTVNSLVRTRLNDFYGGVNRMPDVSIDFVRQPIGNTVVYYDGETSIANLERVYAEGSEDEDYSTVRFDTLHMLYIPTRYFGFLNVIPRGGYRGTWYADTIESRTELQNVLVTRTNLSVDASGRTNRIEVVTSSQTNKVTTIEEQGAQLRSLVELGLETSFRAFKTWDGMGNPGRHVVEPFANYTLVPEPSLTPEQLYQFDDVDSLDKSQFIRFGARNKLQVKRDTGPFDLADVVVYTDFLIEREEDQDPIEDVTADAELRFVEWMSIDFDAVYNLPDAELRRFNTEITWEGGDVLKATTEYRYRLDDSSLLIADVTLFEKRPWAYNGYARYEFEESRLEEVGGFLQRNLDCLTWRLGLNMLPGYTQTDGTERPDEFRVLVQFWLAAFPHQMIGGKHRN